MNFTKYSIVLDQVRNNQITEVAAVLALQVGSEGELQMLQALSKLPEKFSGVALRELDDDSSIAPPVAKSAEIMSEWASRQPKGPAGRGKAKKAEVKVERKVRSDKGTKKAIPVDTDDETRRIWIQVRAMNTYGTLIGKRAEHINNPGAWCLPGGHPNVGEREIVAARRELLEETGLRVSVHDFENLGSMEHKGVVHHFFRVDFDKATDVHSLGLQTTEEMVGFKFVRPAQLAELAADKDQGHKSIRRFVEFIGL